MKKLGKSFIVLLLLFVCFTITGCDIPNVGSILDDIDDSTKIELDDSVKSITINGSSRVVVGNKITLSAVITPDSAPQTVTWSTGDNSIATVTNNGEVTGVSEGRVNITATSVANETISKTHVVTVERSTTNPTAIEITGEDEIYSGNKYTYSVVTTPVGASNIVTWSVNNSDYATISKDGVLTALKEGTIEITAKFSDTVVDTFTVRIVKKTITPQRVTVRGYSSINVGQTQTLQTMLFPLNAIDDLVFSSSDENIATVDSKGRVTGVKEGKAVITVKSVIANNVSKDFNIEVTSKPDIENNGDYSLQEQIKNIYKYANKSVFGVVNYQLEEKEYVKSSIGTGFVYDAWAKLNSGDIVEDPTTITDLNSVEKYCYYLITNRHVVEDAAKLKIYIAEFDKYIDAELCQYDDKIDVAVVYFEYVDYIMPLTLADSSKVERGDFVVAMGNPEGLQYNDSITFGICSNNSIYYSTDTDSDGVNDWDQEYIQHDAAINPGNSGGPLFNLQGEVIGINTMKFSSVDIDTMGFSITTNSLKKVLELLEEGEKPIRPLLGVSVLDMKNAENGKLYDSQTSYVVVPEGLNTGLYISSINAGSVAEKANLKVGDIIVSIGDDEIIESYQVRIFLGKYVVGSNVTTTIGVYRYDTQLQDYVYLELPITF